ncbi:MAG: hypothetical protein U9R32_04085 [Bacteroidota bacterium]|nr:hypothetical protein [Bacteroidota bacterium]
MKKIITIFAVVLLLVASISSCRTSQKCAAYGEVQQHQVDRH